MANLKEHMEENKSKGSAIRVLCPECNRKTKHLVLGSIETDGSELYEQSITISWSDTYQIIQCQGCETISFRHLNWFSENQSFDDDGSYERLYPQRSKDSHVLKEFLNAPPSIKRIYRETIDCFNNELYTLCAAGLRSVVEGICSEQGIKTGRVEVVDKNGKSKIVSKRNLEGKISGLHESGILTKDQASILHEHRLMGNEAVHQLSQPTREELALAVNIVEHMIESLYEIPKKAHELRAIKAQRKKKT